MPNSAKTTLLCRRRAPAISTASRPGRQPADPSLSSSSSSSRHRRPNRLRAPPLSSSRRRRPSEVLRRASSEPILWTVRPLPALNSDSELVITPPALLLSRPHTCFDIFAPSTQPLLPLSPPSWRPDPFDEGTKVVVSVTVEGSPGPVKAMVRLGASVEEAIEAVVDKYRREGRTPKFDQAAAASFQLHRSCFSLEGLSKKDKIGEVGGRRFYLRRTSSEINNFHFGRREHSSLISGDNEIRLQTDNSPSAAGLLQSFLVLIITRLEKIGRKTKRLCRVVACISCI